MLVKRILPIVSVTLLLAASGCARTEQAAGPRAPVVALIAKSLANEFFVTMINGARHDQITRASRYRLLVNGIRNESDVAEQVALIDQMIAMKVDALVIAPADSKAIVPALARARDAGIRVVNIDVRLDRRAMDDYRIKIPYVGPDNQDGAARVGAVAAQRLPPGAQIAILEGVATADNSIQRTAGLVAAAKRAGLDIVTVQSADWDQTKAAALTSNILIRYPKLAAVFCANDNMALGAASAISQAGRQDTVKVSGFDNISAIRPLLLDGRVTVSADQHADELAVYGIDVALEELAGATRLQDHQTPVDIVTRASLLGAAGRVQ